MTQKAESQTQDLGVQIRSLKSKGNLNLTVTKVSVGSSPPSTIFSKGPLRPSDPILSLQEGESKFR